MKTLLSLQAWQSSGDAPVTWPMWTPIMAAQQGDPFKTQRHYTALYHNQQPDVSSVATITTHHHQVRSVFPLSFRTSKISSAKQTCWFRWLVHWLLSWFVWLDGWLVYRFIRCFIGFFDWIVLLVCTSIGLLAGSLAAYVVDKLANQFLCWSAVG